MVVRFPRGRRQAVEFFHSPAISASVLLSHAAHITAAGAARPHAPLARRPQPRSSSSSRTGSAAVDAACPRAVSSSPPFPELSLPSSSPTPSAAVAAALPRGHRSPSPRSPPPFPELAVLLLSDRLPPSSPSSSPSAAASTSRSVAHTAPLFLSPPSIHIFYCEM